MSRSLLAATFVALVAPSLTAQTRETGFLDRTVQVDGRTYRYQVYVPADYHREADWPAILFLHGAGERGSNGLVQTEVGLGSALRRHPERYPAIVIFPQAPEESSWSGPPASAALAALDSTMAEFSIDPARVYLTGLSLGGHGTWYIGYSDPERFAALVPICGWVSGNPRYPSFLPDDTVDPYAAVAERLRRTPVWIFHGEVDPVVPVTESRRLAEALGALGGSVRYSELPGTGHNAWDAAYGSPSLAEWLFLQRRP